MNPPVNPLLPRLLQPFAIKPSQGFTLLELMVVLLLLGILSAIALPSFSRQANRAKEAEGKTTVGSINRAQQLYFVENFEFGALDDLALNLADSQNYTYNSVPKPAEPQSANATVALTTATPIADTLRGFTGKVWVEPQANGARSSQSILCEGNLGEVPQVEAEVCP